LNSVFAQYEELPSPQFAVINLSLRLRLITANFGLDNSSYRAQPHSIIVNCVIDVQCKEYFCFRSLYILNMLLCNGNDQIKLFGMHSNTLFVFFLFMLEHQPIWANSIEFVRALELYWVHYRKDSDFHRCYKRSYSWGRIHL
jgi:hypothetical protein